MQLCVTLIANTIYEFDVSESVSLNKDGAIANVQWDFCHQAGKFISTQGYAFLRDKKTKRAVVQVIEVRQTELLTICVLSSTIGAHPPE